MQSALKQHPDSRTSGQIDALRRLTSTVGTIKLLLPHEHSELCKYMTYRTARKNAVIIKEGDTADCMHATPLTSPCDLSSTASHERSFSHHRSHHARLHCAHRSASHTLLRFIILSGVVSVLHAASRAVSDPLPPKNFSLNAGACFGETALQEHTKRSSTCCAETDVELIVVPKEACVQPLDPRNHTHLLINQFTS